MPAKTADILVETLLAWGVDRVFGLPGDGINASWRRCGPGRTASASST